MSAKFASLNGQIGLPNTHWGGNGWSWIGLDFMDIEQLLTATDGFYTFMCVGIPASV